MSALLRVVLLIFISSSILLYSAEAVHSPPASVSLSSFPSETYYWSTTAVGLTAQLLTLHCHQCERGASDRTGSGGDVPLLSVLRDTLGDASPENDRLSYLWLLSAGRPTVGQRLLSAVPFFYWRIGPGSVPVGHGYPAPLLNLNSPHHPVMVQAGRLLLQWAAFDPLTTSVRASSRSYQANQSDNERLHLETAIGYLRNASAAGTRSGLSEREVNTLIARLELRKSLLGSLLSNRHAARFGQQVNFEQERIRSRNLEVLRQFAEKTGTYFEPLTLAGNSGEFAILWFVPGSLQPSTGTASKPLWKLLNIRNPWSDPSLVAWRGPTFQRSFDADGTLSPEGAEGTRSVALIPLAVYSLSYRQMPLLLIDFRDKQHIQRHEILQRTVTELTSGVIGISHFTNWYYYAGAFAYQTIWSRRGTAANQADRLDCYSQFQTQLALDSQLSPQLHEELRRRAGSLFIDPLDSDPSRNVANARMQYTRLAKAAAGPQLESRLDRERRAELASFGESTRDSVMQKAIHFLTIGTYSHRVAADKRNLAELDRDRRINYQLDYLDTVTRNGTDPNIAFNSVAIDRSVNTLRNLLGDLDSEPVRLRVKSTLARLRTLSPAGEQIAKSLQAAEAVTVSQ